MAEMLGTSGDDTLTGTPEADVLIALGGVDLLMGGGGGDEYRLTQGKGVLRAVISDGGAPGDAPDAITGARGFYASASLGYRKWGDAERIGDDLFITIPGKPHRFRKPSWGELSIEIQGHFSGDAVESLTAGGVDYTLPAGPIGTWRADVLGGTVAADLLKGFRGDDFIDGNGGDDTVWAGGGDNTVFGDDGDDRIGAWNGDDHLFGGAGDDTIRAGGGTDWIETGDGLNRVNAGDGSDYVFGGADRDVIRGGGGWDLITGDLGDDRLIGGDGGDVYRFGYDRAALGSADHWGHDRVRDNGDAAIYDTTVGTYGKWRHDVLEFHGLYGPSDGDLGGAVSQLRTERVGNHMLIATIDGRSSVTVEKQFATGTDAFAVETVRLYAGYWSPVLFRLSDAAHENIGDDRGGKAQLNEFIFGSNRADHIFSDSGTDLIWTGDGADTLIYKESDPELHYDIDGAWTSSGQVADTVMDFDVAVDRFDFSEIKSASFASLTLSEDAEGDAVVGWSSGDFQIASIRIELRGVALADIDESLFVFA